MNKEEVKIRLSDLINRYNDTLRKEKHENVSEETVRTWINEFLGLFGWNVQDTNQVLQERTLSGTPQQRLQEINSPHKRPDYILLNGLNIKSFLDAKSLDVDIFTDADVAYQIRSYGWSAQSPCAFVSNFEQFVIYDTRFVPDPSQPANASTIQLHIDDYLNQFDVLFDHLWHDNICRNHLNELYATTATEGRNRVDSQFMTILSSFRKKLAVELFWNNPDLICSDIALNYYVQVILDRIVFIRVCESKGIEELEKLKQFEKKPEGFWEVFKASCYMEFYTHYDGAMFERDEIFQKIALSDNVFKDFISQLYYPYPYKFDVIPVKVIANIYEEFLGKQLVINNGEVEEVSKEEYIRTNGAIATPEHIVEMVCKQTISLDHVQTVDDLLNITILDPCCGSGVFLVSCYERLAAKMLSILSLNESERTLHNDFFCDNDGQMLLTVSARRAIAKQCIYAIDFDEAAIEVTKMSLALKIVDGNDPLAWEGLGVYGDKILQEIANNIKLGNTLVGMEQSFSPEQIVAIKPFDPCAAFPVVYAKRDGFDYVIGNPPYVETKHYKAALPAMHGYLSNKYSSFEGKADLAVLFIERGLQLLNNQGKLGFIIQRRWFKTEYGSVARLLINSGRYLEKLIDFKATDIFDGRIVYASIMVLSKEGNDHLLYYYMPSDASEIRIRFENSTDDGSFEGCSYEHIPCQSGSSPWLFDSFAVTAIRTRLTQRFGVLSNYPGLVIKDGIQALWKKIYHIKSVSFHDGVATGINGFGETVTVEEGILRGVIYNRLFYPFKDVEPDAYCIFPYRGASSEAIPFTELKRLYPLAHEYLSVHEELIKSSVECRSGELWHTFTREHNQSMYYVDKIIVPMTARDTIGTYVSGKGLYMDNANVWFITIPGASPIVMKAIACIINSSVFSVLGKAGANPQSGGYYKFNKQFLSPIPFPSEKISPTSTYTRDLAVLYDEISALQERYLTSPGVQKELLSQSLKQKWNTLDLLCFDIFEVTEDEKRTIQEVGRTVNRVELLDGAN